MKRTISIFIFIFFLAAACEKSPGEDYVMKYYGDALEDIGYSVSIASDGYIIAGQFTDIVRENGKINTSLSNKNLAVIKTDWNGNVIWKASAGGKFSDWGRKIYQLEDGSLICVGTFTDTTTAQPGETDIFAVKLSSTGEILWQKTYGGPGNQTGIDVIKTGEGLLILGTNDIEKPPSLSSAGNIEGKTNIDILKISDAGILTGYNNLGYPNNDEVVAIKNDFGGNLIILATTEMSDPGMDRNNLLLIRIKANTDLVESKIIGDLTDEYAADLEVFDSGYLIAGTIGKESDDQQAFTRIIGRDLYGIQDPPVTFHIQGSSTSIKAISKYGNNSYILSGRTGSGNAGDMLVFEADASGNPVEGKVKISGSTGLQVANDVDSGNDGYIIAVGKNSYDYNSMITLFKFRF